jgi:glycosyltransferase involved in cell wall biosynthesis
MKKFSVITPCYKMAGTLGRLIKSVYDQNYKNFEMIVVLDGEDKQAETILNMYPQVKWTCTGKTNKGAPYARNLGAKMATGDYYCFLDSDMYLFPGSFRTWAETFDNHPDVDFVYAGYKIGEGSYFSEEFDPYFLKIYNYIDGNFPVKKEAFLGINGWDESLKSLQDWDMWLKIVAKGGKGHFLKNQFFFAKDMPKTGSISYDSNIHWDERIATIKKNNNLPSNDICLTSYAATHHAKRVAKLLGFDYVEPVMLFNKTYTYKLIYLIGHFPANALNNLLPFMDGRAEPPKMNEKIKRVIHWIGSDVLSLRTENMSFQTIKKFVDSVNSKFTQFCQSEQNAKELREVGIEVKVLPLPVEMERKEVELPKEFTVAFYDHGQNDIYDEPFMHDIAQAMPYIKFISFGNSGKRGKTNIKNFSYIGHRPIDEIIKQTSVLLRITKHDGFPVGAIEFMNSGRAVITNQEVLKECFVIKTELRNTIGYSIAKKEIMAKIRELKDHYPKKHYFDEAFENHKRIFNPSKLRNELLGLL